MNLDKAILTRAELLLGEETMRLMNESRVIIFGIGGVGSWCAESLVRSGIKHLTIVDSDNVCVSNVNRQRMAIVDTIGDVKVDAMKKVLLGIMPDADIEAVRTTYCEETAGCFDLSKYDYIIDAIDSLKDKVLLIRNATQTKSVLFSSMGAALKLDPMRIKVSEFWKVEGCPLARALRQRFKKSGNLPKRKFKCVFSNELLQNSGNYASADDLGVPLHCERDAAKARINGSIMHITAIFGLTLAGLVIEDLYAKAKAVTRSL